MKKVLISACLIGDKVRYDGKDNLSPYIEQLMQLFELIPFCPEVEGGLSIPRIPSEIRKGRVYNQERKEVTKYFLLGANKALNICRYLQIELAILKEDSPSCGVKSVYDGTFNRRKIAGQGITTALLRRNGIEVISEHDIPALLEKLTNKKDVTN
ncbi:MAG: DUF523 domain-containing protein [Bacilli bacterium]|jgi:uncharacterized protein YbbK (DUF523 family)|nr:DUF523 domain-containing protein [Bacilli bacterium]